MYHLSFWTSCTVTVCNNHLKYSGWCSSKCTIPSIPSILRPPRNFRHRMGHRYTDELQELLRQGQLRPVCEESWGPAWGPLDQGGGLYQNQFLPAEGGGKIDKLGHLCSEMIWWYEIWVIWTKESLVFCQPNLGVNQRKVELTWTKAEIEAPRIWIQPALSWLIPQEKGKPLEDRQEQQQTLNCSKYSKCSF